MPKTINVDDRTRLASLYKVRAFTTMGTILKLQYPEEIPEDARGCESPEVVGEAYAAYWFGYRPDQETM